MIEPRARVVSFEDADFGDMRIQVIKASTAFPELLADGTELTTVADVLAALRQPSEAMIDAGDKKYEGTLIVEEAFLAMLGQFEKEQSGNASINAAKRRYEAANPLGGPARMFEAIAERIRSGENYYAVLADYGVTVGAK